ncbi:SDR family oxidoreductase [Kitasatospora sp. Root107]|uniref:SDR family oxidoreductase n=1 Tax=Kitasatospora sp. Root107 TaxID=1736424 RepID=UPI00070C50FC|nr:NAD(P)H-binding protein [Kitasatospora sp. Root107]KQV16014.1 NmrA family transcriptional regulator [Kitasatospora sp. Root107]
MIAVTGATGNVGRPLVQALAEAGAQVTAVSRTAVSRAAAELPPGVRHRVADLADPGSLRAALTGAEALFLLIAGSGLELDPDALLGAAKAAGVRRVVLQSSQIVGTRPDFPSHAGLRAFEEAVRQSGLDWTILRPGGFASNAYLWAEPVRAHRTVAAPFGDVGLPVVDPADIAAMAAAALLGDRDGHGHGDGHAGQTYELTGPAAVSPREQAQAIGAALGEPVRFLPQTPAEARAQLLHFMPEPVVDGTLEILGRPSAAEQRVSPDIERVLGRAARPFADWAERNAAVFR